MSDYAYRLLNVFTLGGGRFSGNPLCVFEDGRGLDDATMQALALQFNLSETTFLFPSKTATARVRIFSPSFEMPFAGHPTLGSAHVARALTGAGDRITLEMRAGIIPVTAERDTWTLEARPPAYRPVETSKGELAEMLGIEAADVLDGASWVDTGFDQLVIPLGSVTAVLRCRPEADLLAHQRSATAERRLAYVFAEAADGTITARFFFPKGTAIIEDPATGSACANLGGWFLLQGAKLPLTRVVHQGEQADRPSRLHLRVDAERRIFVSGHVLELGRGAVSLG